MIRYAKPRTLDEALALLGEARWRILAGGTDFYPALGNRPLSENVLDINGLAELRGISETASHVVIGARTTWTELIRHPLPPAFDALKQAAKEVGSAQIQNMASVAGNLCNASPAADGVPALLVLDAEVELTSLGGKRVLPLGEFILGNRKTALRPDEMVTAIRVPKASTAVRPPSKNSARGATSSSRSPWRRRGSWSAMTAGGRSRGHCGRLMLGGGAAACRAGGSACRVEARPARSPRRWRLPVSTNSRPIDDVRGSADYRRAAAREIVVARACSRASAIPSRRWRHERARDQRSGPRHHIRGERRAGVGVRPSA